MDSCAARSVAVISGRRAMGDVRDGLIKRHRMRTASASSAWELAVMQTRTSARGRVMTFLLARVRGSARTDYVRINVSGNQASPGWRPENDRCRAAGCADAPVDALM